VPHFDENARFAVRLHYSFANLLVIEAEEKVSSVVMRLELEEFSRLLLM
jgi:hypothetical protein